MIEHIFQLVLSVIVGGLIGSERQFRHGLGLRTLMLVCLGSTMFTMYSDLFAFKEGDPRRIAAAVVSGVGFLGAGVILRERGRILGLTTAASVWLAAALGMGIGIGQYVIVGAATLLVLVILWGVPRISAISGTRNTLVFEAVFPLDEQKFHVLTQQFEAENLTIVAQTLAKKGDNMVCTWRVYGDSDSQINMMRALMADPAVIEFNII